MGSEFRQQFEMNGGEYQNFLHISDKLKNASSCRILYPGNPDMLRRA